MVFDSGLKLGYASTCWTQTARRECIKIREASPLGHMLNSLSVRGYSELLSRDGLRRRDSIYFRGNNNILIFFLFLYLESGNVF